MTEPHRVDAKPPPDEFRIRDALELMLHAADLAEGPPDAPYALLLAAAALWLVETQRPDDALAAANASGAVIAEMVADIAALKLRVQQPGGSA